MVFEAEIQAVQKAIDAERILMSCFAAGAILGTFSPHFIQMDKNQKFFSLSIGLASAFSFTGAAIFRKQKEGIFEALNKAQIGGLKVEMANTINYEDTIQKIEGMRRLAQYVDTLPFYEQSRWIAQYNLHGLVTPPSPPPQPKQEEIKPMSVSVTQKSMGSFQSEESPIDYSWIDQRFIEASKGVFGAKGSGKSTWLSYEANMFLMFNPEGELRIGDLHFDPEDSKWFPGVRPAIAEQLFIATRPETILNVFYRARDILRARIEAGKKREPKFKFICDEFVGFMSRLDDDSKEQVLAIIQEIQFEGRKYGVDVTLGLHSIKKEISGIDSSVLANMDLLCLGKSLADPNNKLPADFNAKELIKSQNVIQSMLQPGQGFAAIVRKLGDTPTVEVVPELHLEEFTIELQVDPVQLLKDWIANTTKNPTQEMIRERWQEYTGELLHDGGLQVLMEKLK